MSNSFLLYRNIITSNDKVNNDNNDYDDGNGNDDCHYVLNIENTCDNNHYIASLSNHNIMIYDKSTLTSIYEISSSHNDTINTIEASTHNPYLFYSGSSDKTISIWDNRISSSSKLPISRVVFPDEVMALSVGMNDTLLAAGYSNTISFLDIRFISSSTTSTSTSTSTSINYKNIKLGDYADVHTDIITQLKFLSSSPSTLLSAADDGLICSYNTSVSEKESAIQSILNTECPVRRFGIFGSNNEGLYCLSTIETLSVWHQSSALRIGNYNNIREQFNIDYLVDCYYDNSNDTLKMIAGKYDGSGIITKVEPSALSVESTLLSGHSAQIRCSNISSLPSSTSNIIATGGEDSKICTWITSSVINTDSSSSSKSQKHNPSKDRRSKPY